MPDTPNDHFAFLAGLEKAKALHNIWDALPSNDLWRLISGTQQVFQQTDDEALGFVEYLRYIIAKRKEQDNGD